VKIYKHTIYKYKKLIDLKKDEMSYGNIREEELKNKVAQDYFNVFDCTKIIGYIDFCVSLHTPNKKQNQLFETESLLWAEAKQGNKADIYESFVQIILTVGKARTFDKQMPPAYIGAFDAEKIAFISYNEIHDIFYQNDFNWSVAPSNHDTKEFKQVYAKVKTIIENNSLLFYFDKDNKDLHEFIKSNFIIGKSGTTKIQIDKNNFIIIYNKWLTDVKPSIIMNWDLGKKRGIIDVDFYLADLLSKDNKSLKEKLYVNLNNDIYELEKKLNEMGMFDILYTKFKDNQKAHTQFWNKYERPPREEYWDYIIERRDLLVPQDVRERKGSFFTPQIWVELSQKYLADVLGEDWQDEYYIWDCAAGTGNLLAGLTNKYHIWASTLDRQDVDVMHDRIDTMNKNSVKGDGANLLPDHVFQFDFLNDEFTKLPKSLQDIINDPKKRKKLVIYINPPYAEATDGIGKGGKKIDVSKETKAYIKYGDILKKAKNELYAQFLARIYNEIPNCFIAEFSKLKVLQSPNFANFRQFFLAKLEKMFVVPADTFDNVKGQFPIGFKIWNLLQKESFNFANTSVYNEKGDFVGNKDIFAYNEKAYINDWIKKYANNGNNIIGFLAYLGNDFQHVGEVRISSTKPISHISIISLNNHNLIPTCVYLTVRHLISATWLNDRDQFLYPNDGWKTDIEFQNDCLAYTLFHGQNQISIKGGTNHWIPFTEQEVNSHEKFESNFMSKFIKGKINKDEKSFDIFSILLEPKAHYEVPLRFSAEATEVFNAGLKLWRYYHAIPGCNVNASLYDIREHFQGRNEAGKMNNKSEDEHYMELITKLRDSLKVLAKKIEPKVYEYGFLKV